jgi:hypothetical protein
MDANDRLFAALCRESEGRFFSTHSPFWGNCDRRIARSARAPSQPPPGNDPPHGAESIPRGLQHACVREQAQRGIWQRQSSDSNDWESARLAQKWLGETKANMLFCLSDGRRSKEIDLSCRRNVLGSAVGRPGSPAITRTGKRVPGCD